MSKQTDPISTPDRVNPIPNFPPVSIPVPVIPPPGNVPVNPMPRPEPPFTQPAQPQTTSWPNSPK